MFKSLYNSLRPTKLAAATSFDDLRSKLIDLLSVYGVLLGSLIMVQNSIRAFQYDLNFSLAINFAAYLALLFSLILREKIHFRIRAGIIIGLLYLSGVLGVSNWGLLGSGVMTLLCSVLLVGLFFGYKFSIYVALGSIPVVVTIAQLFISGNWEYNYEYIDYSLSWTAWSNWILTWLVFSIGLAAVIGLLQNYLRGNIRTLKENEAKLKEINESLRLKTEELSEAKVLLEHANDVKSRFLEVMSHELRTPVNPIMGATEILCSKGYSDEETHFHLEIIKSSGERLLSLIDQVLSFASLKSGEIDHVPSWNRAEDMVQEIEALFYQAALEKDLELKVSFSCAPKTVDYEFYFDERRLMQLLSELISNGIKFTRSGTISVNWWATPLKSESKYLFRVQIEDTGIGFSKETESHLMEAFSQAEYSWDRRFSGLGIGLAIATQNAEIIGAKINVESVIGKGSVFEVLLQVAARKYTPVKPTKLSTVFHTEYHVLIVEDDQLNQKITRAILQKMGATCSIANDGAMAVDLCQKNEYNFILMDLSMPGMDGIEATTKIRELERCKTLPIIALTANNSKNAEKRCRKAGMNHFLTKPANAEKIWRAVQDVV